MMKTLSRMGADEAQLAKMRQQFEQQIKQGETLLQKITGPAGGVVGLLVLALIGASLYFVGIILMGKRISFKEALAVRVYADVPPLIVSSVLMIILMYVKSPDDIDPISSGRILTSNLGPLFDPKEQVVLATIGNNIDLFQIWMLVLASIGLTIIPDKMKRGQAITIVVGVWLLGLLLKIGWNAMTGSAGI